MTEPRPLRQLKVFNHKQSNEVIGTTEDELRSAVEWQEEEAYKIVMGICMDGSKELIFSKLNEIYGLIHKRKAFPCLTPPKREGVKQDDSCPDNCKHNEIFNKSSKKTDN